MAIRKAQPAWQSWSWYGPFLVMTAGSLPLVPCDSTASTPMRPLPLEEAYRQATVGGKYRMLVGQIWVPQDAARFKDFKELGLRDSGHYGEHPDVPKGYWVYVYPYWYIWRDLADKPIVKRAWGPEQATGEPDTPNAGDIQTAWASKTPDGQDEWLLLEYAVPIVPVAALIYETFNPGAVNQVSAFKLDGREAVVWSGKDPTPVGSDKGVSEIPMKVDFKTTRVKIYLDSKNVPGWNEIDAVGLRDKTGKIHWARSAAASSTYAE